MSIVRILAFFLSLARAETTLEVLQQDQAQSGGHIEFVLKPNATELSELWHLSEGSDFFPLKWLLTMESVYSNQPGSRLIENLDSKFGLLPDPSPGDFALPWAGLATTWSEARPEVADVRLAPGQDLATVVDQPPRAGQVAMVGVNCAFCHTNRLEFGEKSLLVQGAPAMVDLRGFYVDTFASTAMTMLDDQVLKRFLKACEVPGSDQDLQAQATRFVSGLKAELGLNGTPISNLLFKVAGFIDPGYVKDQTGSVVQKAFFEKRPVFIRYLTDLLKISLKLKTVSPELKARMSFLGTAITSNPDLPSTLESYSSIDAFGRIGNMLARRKHPGPLTAVTSFPALWGLKYQAQFHWNANTNSVVMRNIGQAFGLGAVLIHPDSYDSTINLQNLAQMEKTVYKISFPDWRDTGEPIDLAKVRRGCETYHQTCIKCHESARERVGPQKLLLDTFLPTRNLVKTDETYLENQSAPVDGVPFKDALFSLVALVRDRYFEKYSVPEPTRKEWLHTDLRGKELFRDTSLGETSNAGDTAYMNSVKLSGYGARSLAGVWASPPYLHNGSVPNLFELLQPARLRSKVFFLSSREYDSENLGFYSGMDDNLPEMDQVEAKARELMQPNPGILTRIFAHANPQPANLWEARLQAACAIYPERCYQTNQLGNSNEGHEGALFGTELSDSAKSDLLEFLKVLRPPVEYSENRPPIYSWDGQSCKTF